MNLLAWVGTAALGACPYLAEILPDPESVEDSRGEFIEIRMPEDPWHDTLSVYFEEKLVWKGIPKVASKRVLLLRDTSLCPQSDRLFCDLLTGKAFPNSRETAFALQSAACKDSAALLKPKAGKSLVRTDSAYSAWTYAEPTPGIPNAYLEENANDCHLHIDTLIYAESGWKGFWTLDGCDSAWVKALFRSTASYTENTWQGELARGNRTAFETRISSDAVQIQAVLPPDDIPGNDSLDTLIALPGAFPIRMTEVHPCPEEGVPEWFELYNTSVRALSLASLNLCDEKSAFPAGFLQKRESVIFTKDSVSLRDYVGNDDVRIFQLHFGYLKNAADTLSLCYGSIPVDSVFWGKKARIQTHCPDGFSTRTGRVENSPGFQTPGSFSADTALPFSVEWNARLFSKKNPSHPLMLRIRSDSEVLVELISGKGDLLWSSKFREDPAGNTWYRIPLLEKGFPGPNFLRVSQGNREKRIAVILRP